MATKMRGRFPLLLLLGMAFLASVSATYGASAYWEKENPCRDKCLESCAKENDVKRREACQGVCSKLTENESGRCRPPQEEEEGRPEGGRKEPADRPRGTQPGEEERERPQRPHGTQPGEEERERQQHERQQEEEEEEDEPRPWEHRGQEQEPRHRVPRRRPHGQEEEEEEEGGRGGRGSSSSRRARNIPFYFPRQRFETRYRSEQGRIRVLQRFDRRSNRLENLQNYRVVEFEARPNTILLPKHSDADVILVVLRGEPTIHLVDSNNRDSYNLECGDAITIPAGTLSYIVNRNDNQNLRVVKLAVPVNRPGNFEDFFPASSQEQQSYFRGFSRSTLEAAFNSGFEDIRRILLGEQGQQQHGQQGQQEGVIVRIPKEQVQELTRHAKSSSRRGESPKSGPFKLRSRDPIYSNEFGVFHEITPDRNPQLQDLDLSLSLLEMKEASLMLPHFNSRALELLYVDEGRARIEVVGPREKQRQHQEQEQEEEEEEQQQEQEEEEEEEEEGPREMRRYSVKLSEGDVFVIPAAHPVAVNASSNLRIFAFGINAENNQRNFLAGEEDNVLNKIHRQVKEIAFPGSGKQIERLIRRQRESHFVSAQPQQREEEEGRRGKSKGPLFSILGAFN